MLSTTDRANERGQVLVLFAGALLILFLFAALAFDVGMTLLERRDQQNAADAAALAGARYVTTSANYSGSCAGAAGNAAVTAACEIALANGYQNAAANSNVFVNIPPVDGAYRGFPGFVQVRIDATRSAIFAGVLGRTNWKVGANAVAANQPGIHYSFGMLALSPDACKAIAISGTGQVNAASNVQSNSTGALCGGSGTGLSRTGGGILNVTAPDAVCRSAGAIQDQGAGRMTCTQSPFSFALPDPLLNLPAPAKPGLAPGMKEVKAGAVVVPTPASVPDYCPGATTTPPKQPVEATPKLCTLGVGPNQPNRQWILSPGLYPGGLNLKGGVTAFLLPGIYWIGGGGFAASNDASVISVNSETVRTPAVCTLGATPPCTGGGGVLIYNSQLPYPGGTAGPISLGGGGATLNLQPYDYPFGTSTIKLVIFQDRTVGLPGDDVTLNGSTAQAASVRGIIYVPQGDVKVNGSSSVFNMDQVIAQTFTINGNGGTVNVLHEVGVDAVIRAAGLVE